MTSLEDLLGLPATVSTPDEVQQRRTARLRKPEAIQLDEREFTVGPVNQQFLARVFSMDPVTVRKRLARAPVSEWKPGTKTALYDFKTACEFLLEPKMDVETFIRTLHPDRLPNQVNKVYWEGLRTRLKYMLEAREAWRTEDVLDVFGRVGMAIKDQTRLWVENVRETGMLDDKGLKLLGELVDGFRQQVHDELIEIPKRRQTVPIAYEEFSKLDGLPSLEQMEADLGGDIDS